MLAFDAALFGSITLRTDRRMLREEGGAKVSCRSELFLTTMGSKTLPEVGDEGM